METTIAVENIKCGGCANTITKTLSESFEGVVVDIENGNVTAILKDESEQEALKTQLRKMGYPPVGESGGFVESNMLKAKSFVSCAVGRMSSEPSKE